MNEVAGGRVSVVEPVGAAIERVKAMLFRPFSFEKWLIIGFCAWLANLLQGGGGGGGRVSFRNANLEQSYGQIKHEVGQYLPIIIGVGAVVLVLVIALQIVCLWLSSRGRFMFLHCVAGNVAEVKAPWRRYRVQGNSLFLFRLAVGVVALFAFGLLIGAAVVAGISLGQSGGPLPVILVAAIALPIFLLLLLVFVLVGLFTEDFVAPLMVLRNCTCVAAWGEFMGLLGANKGRFALYVLFQIVIGMAVGLIILAVVLATCCCAGCIIMIPYLGTVLLLPIFVFDRSYSLLYLAQYGTGYDVFGTGAAAGPMEPAAPAGPVEPSEPYGPRGPYGPGPVQGL